MTCTFAYQSVQFVKPMRYLLPIYPTMALVAAYGLVIGSAAVVIGAMLVAPLMGPIFGITLGLTSGSRRLLWRALQSEAFGIVFAVAIAALIGLVSAEVRIGPEWLSRTQPTLYDLVIALASGLAGAYALVDEDVSPALPGVAVAVALLPPLAACGLSIAALRWDLAAGAAMLFVANFVAIQVAAAVVFSLFGMFRVYRDPRKRPEEGQALGQFLRRFGLSIVVLLVIAGFLTRTLWALVSEDRLTTQIRATLSRSVAGASGARLTDVGFERESGALEVTATVLTPRPFEPGQVATFENSLRDALGRETHLIVRSLISRDVDRQGSVFTSSDERRVAREEAGRLQVLTTASQVISAGLAEVAGAELLDVQHDDDGEVTAIVQAPAPVGPETVATVQERLRAELDAPVTLVVRTVPIEEATATGFRFGLTRAEAEAAALGSVGAQAQSAVQGWLDEQLPGAVVDDVRTRRADDGYAFTLALLSPRAPTAAEVAEMARAVRTGLGVQAEVTVRYRLGGEVAAPAGGG